MPHQILKCRQGSGIYTKVPKHEGSSPEDVPRLIAVDVPLVPACALLSSRSSFYCLIEQALQQRYALTWSDKV